MGDAQGETKEAWIADFADGTGKRHIRDISRAKKAGDAKKMAKVYAALSRLG